MHFSHSNPQTVPEQIILADITDDYMSRLFSMIPHGVATDRTQRPMVPFPLRFNLKIQEEQVWIGGLAIYKPFTKEGESMPKKEKDFGGASIESEEEDSEEQEKMEEQSDEPLEQQAAEVLTLTRCKSSIAISHIFELL